MAAPPFPGLVLAGPQPTGSDENENQNPVATSPPGQILGPSALTGIKQNEELEGDHISTGDADTCRICRGEAIDGQPMFYPCRCNGSIRFVHQDCLMEWLSHSHKKHCELCKTPFRFTKLYASNMPHSLPTHVLIRHVYIHTVRNIGTWLKFCLVSSVWLGCVPYIIRQVWDLLFWFSDGGFSSTSLFSGSLTKAQAIQALEAVNLRLSTLVSDRTSPFSPLQPSQTTSARVARLMDGLLSLISPSNHSQHGSNPVAVDLITTLSSRAGDANVVVPENTINETVSQLMNKVVYLQPPSLLSEVAFWRNLTNYARVNQVFISIAEGYIITFLVVISFALIFLIREYVVQQQPGLIMGAGFDADLIVANQPRDEPEVDQPEARVQAPADIPERRDAGPRPIARPRRHNLRWEAGDRYDEPENAVDPEPAHGVGVETSTRAEMPIEKAVSPLSEIQLTEKFLAIWRRCGSDPNAVLKVIEDEGLADQMQYWINAIRALPARDTDSFLSSRASVPMSSLSPQSVMKTSVGNQWSEGSDSWVDNEGSHTKEAFKPTPDQNNSSFESVVDQKQKARADLRDLLSDSSISEWRGMKMSEWDTPDESLAKSLSDEQRSEDPSLLEHNNWPFASLRKEDWGDNGTKALLSALEKPSEISPEQQRQIPWKAAQDLRVYNAINRAQEARKSAALGEASEGSIARRNTTNERSSLDSQFPIEVGDFDGVIRTRHDWDAVFDARPISDGSSAGDTVNMLHEPVDDIPSSGHPVGQQNPSDNDDVVPHPGEPQGFLGRIADWLWEVHVGGLDRNNEENEDDEDNDDETDENDEHVVEDIAAEAPFVPVGNRDVLEIFDAARDPQQDQDVVQAAVAAGVDPNELEGVEEVADLDGIMELLGMRGPLLRLIQNALFCTFILAVTVAFGVWIPYNIGRVTMLILTNPIPALKVPLRMIFGTAIVLQDFAVAMLSITSYFLLGLLHPLVRIWSYYGSPAIPMDVGILLVKTKALRLSQSSCSRILDSVSDTAFSISGSEISIFSAASHEALLTIKSAFVESGRACTSLVLTDNTYEFANFQKLSMNLIYWTYRFVASIPDLLSRPDAWIISLDNAQRTTPLDLELSIWGPMDRLWATLAGYSTLCLLGAAYLKRGAAFSNDQVGREWEFTVLDILSQAGGVLKVILIISIEMLVFPLYCGLLLDVALLPLFEGASIISRIHFTVNSPLTSVFVHWFVGTSYMFHFALFVSMCRKIMRKGVLFFIRDPDDPNFHPVRDVLERNVATQLCKILFSALVYGALVVLCLGGVVWGLAFAFEGVLPIHWSSNEPVLEFPIDLLFYNFLMPLAVKFFKPSDGLHSMYSWWFHQCAHLLRLTWFLFDERCLDEEGQHIRKSWKDVLHGVRGDSSHMIKSDDIDQTFREHPEINAFYRPDGRYVRTPASDQVRLPRGTQIFVPVDESNNRLDGIWDSPDGLHGRDSELFKQVYVPPWFRLRISLLILSIWLFAALTGVCITIVPLVFGRLIFSSIIPTHVKQNDVYAFSVGIYSLGSILYVGIHIREVLSVVSAYCSFARATPFNIVGQVKTVTSRVSRVLWTYCAFLLVLPTLFAFVVECYVIIPLHTYFSTDERHIIYFVQSWTLGLLYVKISTRIILWHENTRPAEALRAVLRDGYLNPDARLATRCFILPLGLALITALAIPWSLTGISLRLFHIVDAEQTKLLYRYAYPATAATMVLGRVFSAMLGFMKGWKQRVKDEAYLIGERLHNFGETAHRRSSTAAGGDGVRGARLGARRIDT